MNVNLSEIDLQRRLLLLSLFFKESSIMKLYSLFLMIYLIYHLIIWIR
jgi:hypothetical protein